jgi:hypothetical protein
MGMGVGWWAGEITGAGFRQFSKGRDPISHRGLLRWFGAVPGSSTPLAP